MKVKPILSGLCLLLAAAHSAPAAAATFVPVPIDRVIAAFQSICLQNKGDPPAQVKVGQAAPWKMKAYAGTADVPPGVFLIDSMQVIVDPKGETCTVTSMIDDKLSLEDVAAASSSFLPRGKSVAGEQSDTLLWPGSALSDPRYAVGIKVKKGEGETVATFGMMKLGNTE